jgi:hypothetical protein
MPRIAAAAAAAVAVAVVSFLFKLNKQLNTF